MTKAHKSAAYLETHADLARTVNAERRNKGLKLNSVPMKTKAKSKAKMATRAERPAFRARFVPPDYVTVEQSRAALTALVQRELGIEPPPAPVRPVEETEMPYYVRN